jgi:HEAT repeat protein
MSKKNLSIIAVGGCALLFVFLALRNSPPVSPSGPQSSEKTALAELPVSKEQGSFHRYDTARDPKSSTEAARSYYERREKMFREYHGDGRIDRPLAVVKSGQGTVSEVVTALGAIRRHETITALPYVAKLLGHSDKSVQRVAAEVLCFFGDRRGFDFIFDQRKKEGGFSNWHSLLEKVLVENGQTAYNAELVKMLKGMGGPSMEQRVESYALAKLLARLGDASGLNIIAETFQKYPPESPDSVTALAGLSAPQAREIADDLALKGINDAVKQAAVVVLAKLGDESARRQILEAAQRVTGLPQPQNADGTDKPGMKPKVIGEATPAWDGNAVFALEHGMEVVDPAQAVPVLRYIAIQADNVRFSRTAIELLAKIGDEAARNALWEVAHSVQAKRRTFEDTLFTTTGKALMLFGDPTSASLAKTMFSGDKHGMEVSQFLAETRGWDGLFKLNLFY